MSNPYESPTHCEAGEATYTLDDFLCQSLDIAIGVLLAVVFGPTWLIWEWAWERSIGVLWLGLALIPVWWLVELSIVVGGPWGAERVIELARRLFA